ncbi:hypothetical protein B0H14DRAFT_2565864 [Mycena olivaceomarginata]|nr:hypothetical protein B0H14DRAFT_2565864 [Mycena olivaceomarginata]
MSVRFREPNIFNLQSQISMVDRYEDDCFFIFRASTWRITSFPLLVNESRNISFVVEVTPFEDAVFGFHYRPPSRVNAGIDNGTARLRLLGPRWDFSVRCLALGLRSRARPFVLERLPVPRLDGRLFTWLGASYPVGLITTNEWGVDGTKAAQCVGAPGLPFIAPLPRTHAGRFVADYIDPIGPQLSSHTDSRIHRAPLFSAEAWCRCSRGIFATVLVFPALSTCTPLSSLSATVLIPGMDADLSRHYHRDHPSRFDCASRFALEHIRPRLSGCSFCATGRHLVLSEDTQTQCAREFTARFSLEYPDPGYVQPSLSERHVDPLRHAFDWPLGGSSSTAQGDAARFSLAVRQVRVHSSLYAPMLFDSRALSSPRFLRPGNAEAVSSPEPPPPSLARYDISPDLYNRREAFGPFLSQYSAQTLLFHIAAALAWIGSASRREADAPLRCLPPMDSFPFISRQLALPSPFTHPPPPIPELIPPPSFARPPAAGLPLHAAVLVFQIQILWARHSQLDPTYALVILLALSSPAFPLAPSPSPLRPAPSTSVTPPPSIPGFQLRWIRRHVRTWNLVGWKTGYRGGRADSARRAWGGVLCDSSCEGGEDEGERPRGEYFLLLRAAGGGGSRKISRGGADNPPRAFLPRVMSRRRWPTRSAQPLSSSYPGSDHGLAMASENGHETRMLGERVGVSGRRRGERWRERRADQRESTTSSRACGVPLSLVHLTWCARQHTYGPRAPAANAAPSESHGEALVLHVQRTLVTACCALGGCLRARRVALSRGGVRMGGCGISDGRVLVVLRVFCGERGEGGGGGGGGEGGGWKVNAAPPERRAASRPQHRLSVLLSPPAAGWKAGEEEGTAEEVEVTILLFAVYRPSSVLHSEATPRLPALHEICPLGRAALRFQQFNRDSGGRSVLDLGGYETPLFSPNFRRDGKVEGGGMLAASITSVADIWLVWKALVPLPMMLLRVSAYLPLRMSMDREVSACTSHLRGVHSRDVTLHGSLQVLSPSGTFHRASGSPSVSALAA